MPAFQLAWLGLIFYLSFAFSSCPLARLWEYGRNELVDCTFYIFLSSPCRCSWDDAAAVNVVVVFALAPYLPEVLFPQRGPVFAQALRVRTPAGQERAPARRRQQSACCAAGIAQAAHARGPGSAHDARRAASGMTAAPTSERKKRAGESGQDSGAWFRSTDLWVMSPTR